VRHAAVKVRVVVRPLRAQVVDLGGQCYDPFVFSTICATFSAKQKAVFLKTNVTINFWHEVAVFPVGDADHYVPTVHPCSIQTHDLLFCRQRR
jgi:hypothetical protein